MVCIFVSVIGIPTENDNSGYYLGIAVCIRFCCQTGFGIDGFINPDSILFSQLAGQFIGTLVLGIQIVCSDLQVIRSSVSLSNMKRQIKRYWKFPLIYSWSELLNSTSGFLPAFLLSAFFSSRIVGFYSLGYQILNLPLSFIGSSIGQVFFQRAAVAKHEGTLHSLVEDVVSMLMSISFVPFAVLMAAEGTLFSVVFGAEWYEAGVFAQILALWMLIVFFTNPISTMVSVLEIQEFGLKMNILGEKISRKIQNIWCFESVFLQVFPAYGFYLFRTFHCLFSVV